MQDVRRDDDVEAAGRESLLGRVALEVEHGGQKCPLPPNSASARAVKYDETSVKR